MCSMLNIKGILVSNPVLTQAMTDKEMSKTPDGYGTKVSLSQETLVNFPIPMCFYYKKDTHQVIIPGILPNALCDVLNEANSAIKNH